MTEYTPTTETVRYAYAAHEAHYGGERGYQKQATEFDRWLAEHDRQVAERAWNACAQETGRLIGRQPAALMADILTASNPYRKAAND